MDTAVEKLNRLSLPATILIASLILGGFYYASEVSKQKSIEKQQNVKIEQEKQAQLDKEAKDKQTKEESSQALDACIADAEERYGNQWKRECKSRGELTVRCIMLNETTFSDYAEKNNIPAGKERLSALFDFEKEKNECSCRLPTDIADDISDYRDGLKGECFKKYPQS